MILQQQLNDTLIISGVVTCVLRLIAYAYYVNHKYSKRNKLFILFRLISLTIFDIIKETLKMILQQQLNDTLIISGVVTCVLRLIAYAYYVNHKYSKRNKLFILFRLISLTMLR